VSDPYISGFDVEHAEPISKAGRLGGLRDMARGIKGMNAEVRRGGGGGAFKGLKRETRRGGRHADVSSLPGLRRVRGSSRYTGK